MNPTTFVVFAVLSLHFQSTIAFDYKVCDKNAILFYEEIGCTIKDPVKGECPTSYKCPSQELTPGKCKYNGTLYGPREEIKDTNFCRFSCMCYEPPNIICASAGCGYFPPQNDNCRMKHIPGGCCDTPHCPTDNSVKCEYDGKVYLEGDRIETNACWDCACMKGFRGVLEEPFCKRTECGVELDNPEKLADKCAPVYLHYEGNPKCCPHQFLCPKTATNVKVDNEGRAEGDKCTFGDKIYNFGTVFSATYDYYGTPKNIKCSCSIAPMFTCVQLEY